jgi:hypothetical protein
MKSSTRRYIALSRRLNAAVDNAPGVNRDRLRTLLASELRQLHKQGRQCYWGPRSYFSVVVSQIVNGICRWSALAPPVNAAEFC